jgi:hypothetical protein
MPKMKVAMKKSRSDRFSFAAYRASNRAQMIPGKKTTAI